jgi:hypothetical protein
MRLCHLCVLWAYPRHQHFSSPSDIICVAEIVGPQQPRAGLSWCCPHGAVPNKAGAGVMHVKAPHGAVPNKAAAGVMHAKAKHKQGSSNSCLPMQQAPYCSHLLTKIKMTWPTNANMQVAAVACLCSNHQAGASIDNCAAKPVMLLCSPKQCCSSCQACQGQRPACLLWMQCWVISHMPVQQARNLWWLPSNVICVVVFSSWCYPKHGCCWCHKCQGQAQTGK